MATTFTLKRKLFAFGFANLRQAFTGMSTAARTTAQTAAKNAMANSNLTGSALKQVGKDAFKANAVKDLATKDRLIAGAKGVGGLVGGTALVGAGAAAIGAKKVDDAANGIQ